jgi:hypothetical protein
LQQIDVFGFVSQFVEIVGLVNDDLTVQQFKATNYGDNFGKSIDVSILAPGNSHAPCFPSTPPLFSQI